MNAQATRARQLRTGAVEAGHGQLIKVQLPPLPTNNLKLYQKQQKRSKRKDIGPPPAYPVADDPLSALFKDKKAKAKQRARRQLADDDAKLQGARGPATPGMGAAKAHACDCYTSKQIGVLRKQLHESHAKQQLLEHELAKHTRMDNLGAATNMSTTGIHRWSGGHLRTAMACFEFSISCADDDAIALVCLAALLETHPELGPVVSNTLMTDTLLERALAVPRASKEMCVRRLMRELKRCDADTPEHRFVQAALGLVHAVCDMNLAAARHHLLAAAHVRLWTADDGDNEGDSGDGSGDDESASRDAGSNGGASARAEGSVASVSFCGGSQGLRRRLEGRASCAQDHDGSNVLALSTLAKAAASGLYGFPRSRSKACELALRGAMMGDASSQFLLGVVAAEGFLGGEERSDTYAFAWYRQAADRHLPQALVNLGNCYALGIGTEKSEALAVDCFRQAGQRGHGTGAYNLAMCYRHGRGVKQSMSKAIKWLTRAAEAGHAPAQYELGLILTDGEHGASKQVSKGMVWLKKAAEQDHVKAMSSLIALLLASKDMARRKEGAVWLARVKELAKNRCTGSSSSASATSHPVPAAGSSDTALGEQHGSAPDEADRGDQNDKTASP